MGGMIILIFKDLLLQLADEFGMKLDDLCFAVSTRDFDFPFSFFAFEDEDFLGLLVTDENGAEKLHVIVKSEIVYFRIHYLDELELLMGDDGESHVHRSYN